MSGHLRWADLRDNRRFRDATGVDRHLGPVCMCPLIECCHNEDADTGGRFRLAPSDRGCGCGVHAHSGSPVSGYTQPWEDGDDSWRGDPHLASLARRVTEAPREDAKAEPDDRPPLGDALTVSTCHGGG